MALLQKVTEANRAAVRSLVSKSTNFDGRVREQNAFMKQFNGFMDTLMGGSAMKKVRRAVPLALSLKYMCCGLAISPPL